MFKRHITWNTNGNNYAAFDGKIELVNLDKSPASPLVKDGWKFEIGNSTRCDYNNSYNDQCFIANFTDTFNILHTVEKFDISPDGFIRAYKRFLRLSEFKGYKLAALEIENADLKNDKASLYTQISELNAEIHRLRDVISNLA